MIKNNSSNKNNNNNQLEQEEPFLSHARTHGAQFNRSRLSSTISEHDLSLQPLIFFISDGYFSIFSGLSSATASEVLKESEASSDWPHRCIGIPPDLLRNSPLRLHKAKHALFPKGIHHVKKKARKIDNGNKKCTHTEPQRRGSPGFDSKSASVDEKKLNFVSANSASSIQSRAGSRMFLQK